MADSEQAGILRSATHDFVPRQQRCRDDRTYEHGRRGAITVKNAVLPAPAKKKKSSPFNELILQLRLDHRQLIIVVWRLGVVIAMALYLTRNGMRTMSSSVVIGVAAAISLVIFLGLEYKQLLTRLTGLRPFSADPYGVKSALFFWLTGVPGLMFRSSATDDLATETEARTPRNRIRPMASAKSSEMIVFVVAVAGAVAEPSFAAEAFVVIPTGSMAETLYGYQRVVKCPENCGLEFPVNCSERSRSAAGRHRGPIVGCTCPACRYNIDFKTEDLKHPGWKKPDWNSTATVFSIGRVTSTNCSTSGPTASPTWSSSNTPATSKSFGLAPAADTDAFPQAGPISKQTPMNYIKRLIGLPGETIAIHRGNLYVLPPGSTASNTTRLERGADQRRVAD